MNNLIIIGARGFGREVYLLYRDCHRHDKDWSCRGFLDSKTDALDGYDHYPPIIGSPYDYTPQEDDVFICALGDPKYRKQYAEMMLNKGAKFINLIHPDTHIDPHVKIGVGCIICRDTEISADASIGDFVVIFSKAVLGHDVKIGNYCHVGSFCFFGGFSTFDEGVTMHPCAQILPHKKVGAWATIGAGSVVIRNVKAGTTVFGVPATKI